jgi:hypothetical protein
MGSVCGVRGPHAPTGIRPAVLVLSFLAAWASAFLAGPTCAKAQDIHDQLVIHLTFDGDVLDHSGNGNDGTIVRPEANPTPFVMGIITQNRTSASAFETLGSCLGPHMESNNYITFGMPAAGSGFDFDTDTDFSFSFWGLIPGTAYDDPAWISNKDWDSGGNIGYVIATQGPPGGGTQAGGFKYNFTTDSGPRNDPGPGGNFRCSDCGLNDGNWHHYAVTFTRLGDAVLYVDGNLLDEKPLTGGVGSLDAGLAVNVMQDGTGNYTDGTACASWNDASICDLGVWKRAITPDEVTLIYNQGLQGISALD